MSIVSKIAAHSQSLHSILALLILNYLSVHTLRKTHAKKSIPTFPSCTKQLGLYAIVPSAEWVQKVLEYGVDTVQLRVKTDDSNLRTDEIYKAVEMAKQFSPDTRLFINDHWQLAIEAQAYGVHLGQEDLDQADLEAIRTANLRLGISTHNLPELQRAHTFRPSYIAIGAIYPTTLKKMPTAPVGLNRLKELAYLMSDYPLVAIGGITQETARDVLACGVGSFAVVSAIVNSDDPHQAVRDLKACFIPATTPSA